MMGPIFALFRFTVRQTLRDPKFWAAAGALLMPCVLALVVRRFDSPATPEAVWRLYHGLLQFLFLLVLVPLICMIYGTGLIGAEVQSRTIIYLITRKLHRPTVLAARFVALAAVLIVVCDLAVLALHGSIIGGRPWPMAARGPFAAWDAGKDLIAYLWIVPVGVVGFLSIFTLLGVMTARPLALSLLYLVIFELVLGNLPASAGAYSVVHQLRASAVAAMPELSTINPEVFIAGKWGIQKVLTAAAAAFIVSCVFIRLRELAPSKVARD